MTDPNLFSQWIRAAESITRTVPWIRQYLLEQTARLW